MNVNYHAALKFDEIVSDPQKRDALANILPAEVMANLSRWADVIVKHEREGGAQKGLFKIVRAGDNHHHFEWARQFSQEDINTCYFDGQPLLHFVVDRGRTNILRCLSDKADLDLNIRHTGGYTALMNAFGDVMEVLLKHERVDVNAVCNRGETALHIAIRRGQAEKVCNLLKHAELDVNKVNTFGETSIFICFANQAEIDIFDTLLSDPRTVLSHKDNGGNTIKHCVSRLGDLQRGQALSILRKHQQDRFQRAKQRVKILQDWCVEIAPGNEKYLPEDVLSKYVLPYTADVLSPLEEIGDTTI